MGNSYAGRSLAEGRPCLFRCFSAAPRIDVLPFVSRNISLLCSCMGLGDLQSKRCYVDEKDPRFVFA